MSERNYDNALVAQIKISSERNFVFELPLNTNTLHHVCQITIILLK